MDRGIQYSYHNGSAIKNGFFGFDRTAGEDGLGAFTFIEDATNTNNIFTHTLKGAVQSIKIEQQDLDYEVSTTLTLVQQIKLTLIFLRLEEKVLIYKLLFTRDAALVQF